MDIESASERDIIMLFKQKILKEIAAGRISVAFRRWKRPTVKTGGNLRTAIGLLAIDAVDPIGESEITPRDATRAGFRSREELMADLKTRREGNLYRVRMHYVGADPRQALRQKTSLSKSEIDELKTRLAQMDNRSRQGSWTESTIKLIAKHPGKRAADLAAIIGMETKRFKSNVRKLKELGLTESLEVGYRLSPRGQATLGRVASAKRPS